MTEWTGMNLDYCLWTGSVLMENITTKRCNKSKAIAPHIRAGEQNLVLRQEATDEKSNGMAAIPALLKRLNINVSLNIIDAMGNQETLYDEVQTFYQQSLKGLLKPDSQFEES